MPSLFDVHNCVQALVARGQVIYSDGFIFLAPKVVGESSKGASEDYIRRRHAGYRCSEIKRRTARIVMRLFAFLPGVMAVAVVNRVGWGTAGENSDIDFFVVTRPGMLYVTRQCMAGLAAVLRMRPRPGRPGGICLSFFVSAATLDMSGLRFQPADIHFAYWLMQAVPLYDPYGVCGRVAEENTWLGSFFSTRAVCTQWHAARAVVRHGALARWWKACVDWCALPCERACRIFQGRLLRARAATEPLRVPHAYAWSDAYIKLHWNDTRKEIYDVWMQIRASLM